MRMSVSNRNVKARVSLNEHFQWIPKQTTTLTTDNPPLGAVLYLLGKYAVYSVICTKITIVNGAVSWQNDEKWQSRTGLQSGRQSIRNFNHVLLCLCKLSGNVQDSPFRSFYKLHTIICEWLVYFPLQIQMNKERSSGTLVMIPTPILGTSISILCNLSTQVRLSPLPV